MNKEQQENQKNRIVNSVTLKLIVVGILILLLLIPTGMIKRLISERETRRDETVSEVTSKWGNSQTLCGPILTIPYLTYQTTNDGVRSIYHQANFLPEKLTINGILIPEIRKRGLYKVIAYNSKLNISGSFIPIEFNEWKTIEKDIKWDEAFISFGINDLRGINKDILINWNDTLLDITPGLKNKNIISRGISAFPAVKKNKDFKFSFTLDINGSHYLNFVPLGKETNVNLKSTWNTPSFDGAFLPDERHVTDTGFTAYWNVLQLNRSYPQKWIDDEFDVNDSEFGVRLLFPVDTYQKAMRSAKYSLLFISLTFLVFFFSEVLNKKRIHPVQYLLVGIALVVFYSLLIAFSEHIGFNLAYLIASLAVIGLITIFSNSILNSRIFAVVIFFELVALYLFLFIVLQLSDFSLLMGSIGLFVILSIVMYFSKKIDWYGTVNKKTEND